jgi:DNA polymerase
MEASSKTKALKKIRDEVWNLKESPLYSFRTSNNYYPVLGEGSHNAKIMFIGEAPGRNEAETGRPFCGAAGKILDELLSGIGVSRSSVYVTNIVKDRPPENRDPLPTEIAIYAPFLDKQIEIIKPKIIATLGRFSMDYIMRRYGLSGDVLPIGKLHGTTHIAHMSYGPVYIVPLYHPAIAIYNRTTKEVLEKDFLSIKKLLNETKNI